MQDVHALFAVIASSNPAALAAAFTCPLLECSYITPVKTNFVDHLCAEKHADHLAGKNEVELVRLGLDRNTAKRVFELLTKPFTCPLLECSYSTPLSGNFVIHLCAERHADQVAGKNEVELVQLGLDQSIAKRIINFLTKPFTCPLLECSYSTPLSGTFVNHLCAERHADQVAGKNEVELMQLGLDQSIAKRIINFLTKLLTCPLLSCSYSTPDRDAIVIHLCAEKHAHQVAGKNEVELVQLGLDQSIAKRIINFLTKLFTCPLLSCSYRTSFKPNFIAHLRTGKHAGQVAGKNEVELVQLGLDQSIAKRIIALTEPIHKVPAIALPAAAIALPAAAIALPAAARGGCPLNASCRVSPGSSVRTIASHLASKKHLEDLLFKTDHELQHAGISAAIVANLRQSHLLAEFTRRDIQRIQVRVPHTFLLRTQPNPPSLPRYFNAILTLPHGITTTPHWVTILPVDTPADAVLQPLTSSASLFSISISVPILLGLLVPDPLLRLDVAPIRLFITQT